MFDIKWIRDNPDAFDEGLRQRGLEPASAALMELDEKRRRALTRAQEIQAERNTANTAIGVGRSRGEDVTNLIEKVTETKKQEAAAEEAARAQAPFWQDVRRSVNSECRRTALFGAHEAASAT